MTSDEIKDLILEIIEDIDDEADFDNLNPDEPLRDQLDPRTLCPDDLVRRVPDLRTGESIEGWRERTGPRQRSADEVMRELDLHYGMTWGLADANLRRLPPPGRIDQYAIWQRRRALEFAIAERDWANDEWDIIDLSTIDADTDGTAGNQAFKYIGAAAFGGVDGQLRFSSGILQGDVNGDRVADFEVRIAGVTSLLATDFVL